VSLPLVLSSTPDAPPKLFPAPYTLFLGGGCLLHQQPTASPYGDTLPMSRDMYFFLKVY